MNCVLNGEVNDDDDIDGRIGRATGGLHELSVHIFWQFNSCAYYRARPIESAIAEKQMRAKQNRTNPTKQTNHSNIYKIDGKKTEKQTKPKVKCTRSPIAIECAAYALFV